MSRKNINRLILISGHILGKKGDPYICLSNHLTPVKLGGLLFRGSSSGSTPKPVWPGPAISCPPPNYATMATLETLNFDNLVLRTLPIDEEEGSRIREVHGACFSKVKPTPVKNPVTVAYSSRALALLDLPESELEGTTFSEYFSGNKLLPGSDPAAHCYCGHQFGHFAGQLGDGAAMYLGEIVNKAGERWELQVKGAGLTPYSRTADGRKVLRSSIREFLCSEALHSLGIPTTRAGSCVTSDSTVIRDIYYTGNPIEERCTVVSRIAPTFIRFGSFQICKPPDRTTGREGPSVGRHDILEQMMDYVIKTFYTPIWEEHKDNKEAAYKAFYREVVLRTARLVADWQCIGWCHGVLNTDNMSILGLTIDYGPYGFMDRYDPDYICNASDNGGRYTYKNQPDMCKWNCLKLAEALQFIIPMTELAPILEEFEPEFERHYLEKMRRKLGILKTSLPEDETLVSGLLEVMEQTGSDFTNTFRILSKIPLPGHPDHDSKLNEVMEYLVQNSCTVTELRKTLVPGIDPRQLQMFKMLMETNPGLLDQIGIGYKRVVKEIAKIEKLNQMKDLTDEIKQDADRKQWKGWIRNYIERLTQEGEYVESANTTRVSVMNSTNPRFILRNYVVQLAISMAEKGDFSEVKRVLKMLEDPYSEEMDLSYYKQPTEEVENPKAEGAAVSSSHDVTQSYDGKVPEWAADLRVT